MKRKAMEFFKPFPVDATWQPLYPGSLATFMHNKGKNQYRYGYDIRRSNRILQTIAHQRYLANSTSTMKDFERKNTYF